MSQELVFVVLSLATWRLASLTSSERGPFDLFVWIRSLAGIQHSPTTKTIESHSTKGIRGVIADGLLCVWCNSIWYAIGLTLAWVVWGDVVAWVTVPLAMSTIAVFINEHN